VGEDGPYQGGRYEGEEAGEEEVEYVVSET
jgi:hypothetical protein